MSLTKMMQRKILFIVILVVLLAGVPFQSASAALRTCRTDPIIWLSDGNKISLSVRIAADPADVREILYELHVPAGVTATKIVFTGGDLAKKEVVTLLDDQPLNTYTSDTVVYMYTEPVEVSATSRLQYGVAYTSHGLSGEHLMIDLGNPGKASQKDT